ncbi:MAG: hypothetical protein V4819_05780 [Verrucomicrobiota bacterium]
MKSLQTLLLVILCSCLSCEATSKGNSKLNVASFLERSLIGKLSNQPLPSSWDEIEPVVEIRAMDPRGWVFAMKTINSFALVPGAPVIIKDPGISGDYYGKRLFLISRSEDFVAPDSSGRYVILIDPEGTDPNAIRTYSHFIPEATAQIILGQLKGFDPKKTSVAFEDLPVIEKRFDAEQKELDDFAKTLRSKPKQRPGSDLPPHSADTPAADVTPAFRTVEWSVAGVIAAGLVFWYLRKKTKIPGGESK